ncbi:MAG: glycoside hydrolase family 3 protein [Anaerolineae bacterium]
MLALRVLPAPAPVYAAQDPRIVDLIRRMSVEEKVGQLFLVTFVGSNVTPESDIGVLIQQYRVGGVVLLASNRNFSNEGDTPAEVAHLTNHLQQLALTAPSPAPAGAEAPRAAVHIPLFVAVDHEGDGWPYTRITNGMTPLPSAMALGATWDSESAYKVGEIVGRELKALGINMLLGPSLDVLSTPRPFSGGDLGVRTLGGDPFWVGRLGSAYIQGVHEGGGGRVATIAKHFPGHGESDRRADEEAATVHKSLQQLYQIELAPFFVATRVENVDPDAIADGLMPSHIRYRGLQGNIRQLTPPISFAPELLSLMELPELAPWRAQGGLLVSDALGVRAVRRYYDPQEQSFPARRVALDAFLAGNDLLLLSQYALTSSWPEQFENMKATIQFFREKYQADADFRKRVDNALYRILRLKLRLYVAFTPADVLVDVGGASEAVGQSRETVVEIAKKAFTLIYPGPDELADRIPSPPLPDEEILIVTDGREVQDCPDCPPFPLLGPTALQEWILRLYGPEASGQVLAEHVHSITYAQLKRLLTVPTEQRTEEDQAIESWITSVDWLIFANLDLDVDRYPFSDALKQFLRLRSDSLRGKAMVVIAFNAPYFLDTTEISKLTAYYAAYSKTDPFIEVAVRALFKEFTPSGSPPVSVAGINYDLIQRTEPDTGRVVRIMVENVPATKAGTPTAVGVNVGDTLDLVTSPILDHNGHVVPDGTPVEFRLFYPSESLELPRISATTVDGVARASVVLERTGQLEISLVSRHGLRSTTVVVTIQGGQPAVIETVEPSPTATSTFTPTPEPSPTSTLTPTATDTPVPTDTPTPTPTFTPTPEPTPKPSRFARAAGGGYQAFFLSIGAVLLAGAVGYVSHEGGGRRRSKGVQYALWGVILATLGYILWSVELIPAVGLIEQVPDRWEAPLVSLACGLLSLVSLLWDRR